MVLDKRRLQIVTAGVLTLLMIVMGLASGTHALTLYRTTLHRQMAENNEIVKANLSIIIDQITRQYVDKTKVIAQIQSVLEALEAKGWKGFACVLDEQGHILAHPDKKMVGMRPPLETYEPQDLLGTVPPPVTDLPGVDGTSAIYRTQADIIAIDWLPDLMTYLCVHTSQRPIAGQLSALRQRLIWVGLLVIALFSVGSWVFVGWLVDRYEHHLSRSEYRNRTLVQSSAPIVVTTQDGIIRDVNPAAENLFESTQEGLLNTPLEKLWPKPHLDVYRFLLQVPPGQTAVHNDLDINTCAQNQKPVDVRACRIEYGDQDAVYFLLHDVTENRRSREELLTANLRLRDLDRLKTDFINTVSHELRTPLTSMRWSTESLLQLVDPGDETVAKLLRIIRDDNQRLASMIEELLGFSRLDAGKLKLDIAQVDLVQILGRVREEILPLALKKNIDVVQMAEPQTLMIPADAKQLHRIAVNILDNAIKYTPENGRVSIWVEETDREGVLRITDSGIGISENDQGHIFEKFYRTDQVEVQTERGTGLGLAIVKGITEAHGGTILVNSRVGQGATFVVTLPLRA
jgi:PAS domain S-box-containing protein